MSVKTVVGTLLGFLSHHVADLNAVDQALSSILAALPINAQTRETIQNEINTVRDSAVNISNAIAAFTDAPLQSVVIRESDIEAALAAILPGAIAAYIAAHPDLDATPIPAPVATPTA